VSNGRSLRMFDQVFNCSAIIFNLQNKSHRKSHIQNLVDNITPHGNNLIVED